MILGVDPGASGALALLNPQTDSLEGVWAMPINKQDNKIDLYKLAAIVDNFAHDVVFAVIEEVHSMPGQGVASMFSFGQAFGLIKGILASYNIPMYHVGPSVWKGSMGLGRIKEDSRKKASQLFGAGYFPLKKDEGKAEAALISYFGKRFLV